MKHKMPEKLTASLNGNEVRGFFVLVKGGNGKVVSYPCSDETPYNGYEAISVMRLMMDRGLDVRAWTHSPDPDGDQITLEEMQELFPAVERPDKAVRSSIYLTPLEENRIYEERRNNEKPVSQTQV